MAKYKKKSSKKITNQYDFGGDLGEIGNNYLKGSANTLGSVVGYKPYTDSDFKGKGSEFMKGYSNITSGIVGAAAPIAANMVLPGSGTALSAVQNQVKQFNPQDEVQLDENGQPIIDPTKQIGQMAGQLAGQVGGMAAGQMKSNIQNPSLNYNNYPTTDQSTFSPYAKYGGNLYQMGGDLGNLTRYEHGGTHEESPLGGIPVGNTLVEQGETRFDDTINSNAYKYNKHLIKGLKQSGINIPDKYIGKTPADASKLEDKRYSRDNDIFSKNALEREKQTGAGINAITNASNYIGDMINNHSQMAKMGGNINQYPLGGGIEPINPNYMVDSMATVNYTQQHPELFANKQWSTNLQGDTLYNQSFKNNRPVSPKSPIEFYGMPSEQAIAIKNSINTNAVLKGKPQQYPGLFGNPPIKQMGGSLNKKMYKWGGPNMDQWIPDDLDNVEDPSLNTSLMGINNDQNYLYNQQRPTPFGVTPMEQMPSRQFQPANTPDQLTPYNSYTPESITPEGEKKAFDPNSLYAAGNFLGAGYHIYRGLKGGDKVNYERVNPDLVNYQASRDINSRNIKENFRSTEKDIRNSGMGAGEYINTRTQLQGQRDVANTDQIAKSIESEYNTNAGLKNQGKYFNAQVQQQEANARQQEKDIASNTLGYGLTQAGEAIAGTGRDKQLNMSQIEAEKMIQSEGYKGTRDKKGNILYITNDKGSIIRDFRKK